MKDFHMFSKRIQIQKSEINYTSIDNSEQSKCCNIWRFMNIIMMVFFIMAAVVQYNDPDPYIWIPIYTIPAIFAFLSAVYEKIIRNSMFMVTESVYVGAVISYALFIVISNAQAFLLKKLNFLSLEEGREVSGLLIVSAWCVLQLWYVVNISEKSLQRYFISKKLIIMSVTALILSLIPPILWSICHISNIKEHVKYCHEMC